MALHLDNVFRDLCQTHVTPGISLSAGGFPHLRTGYAARDP